MSDTGAKGGAARGRRGLALVAAAGLAVFTACEDGLIRPPAAEPARVVVAAVLEHASASDAQAWARLDGLAVRVLRIAGQEVVQETTTSFDPTAAETVLGVSVPLEELTESVQVELTLRAGSQVLFQGGAGATLTAGQTSELLINPSPVLAGITCAGAPLSLRAYGAPRPLGAFPLFASGDTITSLPLAVTWSTSDATTVAVSTSGSITGLKDGSATVTCRSGQLSSTRDVQVFAIVKSIRMQPAQATIPVGAEQAFTPEHLDSLGNIITGPRTTAWTSSNNAVATIGGTGRATGIAPGTVTIRATSGEGSGTAALTVVYPPPLVTTGQPSGVGSTAATISGSVNPRGAPTVAWFEWGTDPALNTFGRTPDQQLDPGNAFQGVTATLGNLLPNQRYYYRAAAQSPGGSVKGEILSFTTVAPPLVRTVGFTLAGTNATLGGAVNPQGLAGLAWFEWGTSPELVNPQTTTPINLAADRSEIPFQAFLANLAAGTTYYFRAAASTTAGTARGQTQSFIVGTAPTVITGAPANVLDDAATLQGSVNPNGAATEAWFEWGIGSAPTSFQSTPRQPLGTGTTALSVVQLLTGLQPLNTYSYRVAAQNAVGISRGTLVSFVTTAVPDVTGTGTVWDYSEPDTAWSVEFHGVVNANGAATQAWFQWSASPTFSGAQNTPRVNVGSGFSPVTYSVRDLLPSCGAPGDELYWHYRAVASNSNGTTFGAPRRTYCEGEPEG